MADFVVFIKQPEGDQNWRLWPNPITANTPLEAMEMVADANKPQKNTLMLAIPKSQVTQGTLDRQVTYSVTDAGPVIRTT